MVARSSAESAASPNCSARSRPHGTRSWNCHSLNLRIRAATAPIRYCSSPDRSAKRPAESAASYRLSSISIGGVCDTHLGVSNDPLFCQLATISRSSVRRRLMQGSTACRRAMLIMSLFSSSVTSARVSAATLRSLNHWTTCCAPKAMSTPIVTIASSQPTASQPCGGFSLNSLNKLSPFVTSLAR